MGGAPPGLSLTGIGEGEGESSNGNGANGGASAAGASDGATGQAGDGNGSGSGNGNNGDGATGNPSMYGPDNHPGGPGPDDYTSLWNAPRNNFNPSVPEGPQLSEYVAPPEFSKDAPAFLEEIWFAREMSIKAAGKARLADNGVVLSTGLAMVKFGNLSGSKSISAVYTFYTHPDALGIALELSASQNISVVFGHFNNPSIDTILNSYAGSCGTINVAATLAGGSFIGSEQWYGLGGSLGYGPARASAIYETVIYSDAILKNSEGF